MLTFNLFFQFIQLGFYFSFFEHYVLLVTKLGADGH